MVVLLENCIISNSFILYRYIWYLSSGDLLRVIDAHYKVLAIELTDFYALSVIRCLPDMSSIVTGGDVRSFLSIDK